MRKGNEMIGLTQEFIFGVHIGAKIEKVLVIDINCQGGISALKQDDREGNITEVGESCSHYYVVSALKGSVNYFAESCKSYIFMNTAIKCYCPAIIHFSHGIFCCKSHTVADKQVYQDENYK